MRALRPTLTCLLLLAAPATGCGLISQDFEGDVEIKFTVDEDKDFYDSTFIFDPNENPDVRENRDSINEGQVVSVYLKVLGLRDGNNADFADGTVWVGDQEIGSATVCSVQDKCVAEFDSIPLVPGELFKLTMNSEQRQFLSALAFEQTDPVQFRFRGETDREGVHLDAEVIFRLEFSASP